MGSCKSEIQRIIFDVTDTDVTKVTLELKWLGDCPVQLKSVVNKTYPAKYSAVQIMTMDGGVKDYLNWDEII